MHLAGHIEVNLQVMLGKPVIRGTRIPVELVLRKLSEGATEQALIEAYPQLTPPASKRRWYMRPRHSRSNTPNHWPPEFRGCAARSW